MLAEAVDRRGAAFATSADGSLEVALEPTGDGAWAEVVTETGVLSGPDHWVEIRESSSSVRAAS